MFLAGRLCSLFVIAKMTVGNRQKSEFQKPRMYQTVTIFRKTPHMGLKHASREKKLSMVILFIFVQINIYIKGFQKMKIRPLKGFEKMRFLCFYIIGV